MKLYKALIISLADSKGFSQNQLALHIGISRGSLSNALSGRRGVGRKTLVGLLRLFPTESVESLTQERRGGS